MRRIAFASLLVLVFSIPWENAVVIAGVGTVSRLIGVAAFGAGLLAVLASGEARRPPRFLVLATAFVAWALAGTLWSPDAPQTLTKVATFVQLLVLAWLVWELAPNTPRQHALLQAFVLGAFVAIIGTLLAFRTGAAHRVRFAAEGFNPNDLGFMLVLAVPVAWQLSLHASRPWQLWLNRAYLPAALFAIALTGSRGAAVAAAVALLIVPWTMPRLTARANAGIAVCALAGAVYAVGRLPESTIARLASTRSEIQEGDLSDRAEIWRAGLEVLPERPVVGFGAGTFEIVVKRALGHEKTAHNAYLAVAVEQGLLGLALFLALFGAAYAETRPLPSLERRFATVLLFTLVVGLLPRTWEARKPTWFMLSLLVCQGATASRAAGYRTTTPRGAPTGVAPLQPGRPT